MTSPKEQQPDSLPATASAEDLREAAKLVNEAGYRFGRAAEQDHAHALAERVFAFAVQLETPSPQLDTPNQELEKLLGELEDSTFKLCRSSANGDQVTCADFKAKQTAARAAISQLFARQSAETTPPSIQENAPVWLVERGQLEWQEPPMWLGKAMEWTTEASRAVQFATRAEAEAVIKQNTGIEGVHTTFGRATEHIFFDRRAPRETTPLQVTPERNRLNRSAYEKLIAEDVAWLRAQPGTLERRHIEVILDHAVEYEYGAANWGEPTPATGESK